MKKTPARKNLKQLTELLSYTSDYLLGITDNPFPPSASHQDPPTSADKATISVSPYGGVKKTVQIPLEKLHAIEAILRVLED